MDDLTQQTRPAAFRLLLETARAVSANQIAAELGEAPSGVKAELGRLGAAGRVPAGPVVLFFPDDRGSVRTIDDRCAKANFFESREVALSWSAQRQLPLLSANRGIESRYDDGDNR